MHAQDFPQTSQHYIEKGDLRDTLFEWIYMPSVSNDINKAFRGDSTTPLLIVKIHFTHLIGVIKYEMEAHGCTTIRNNSFYAVIGASWQMVRDAHLTGVSPGCLQQPGAMTEQESKEAPAHLSTCPSVV